MTAPLTLHPVVTHASPNCPASGRCAVPTADSINPSLFIDRPGNYLIALTVSDGKLSSLPDTIAITTENSPPVANAGVNQSISLGATVTLDGSRSSDVNGNPLSFRWSLLARPAGSSAVLVGANSVRPSLTADFPGTYVAQLIVNDGIVDSAPSNVTLTTGNAAPIADAGPDQTVPVGSLVTLDGSASRDPEGAMLSLAASLIGKPVGSSAVLTGSNSVHPTFSADLLGSYIAQLIVLDGALASPPSAPFLHFRGDLVRHECAECRVCGEPHYSEILDLGNHRATDGGTRGLDGWQDHGLNHHPGPATRHCTLSAGQIPCGIRLHFRLSTLLFARLILIRSKID